MLKELIESGFGYDEEHYENCLNCAEKILYGANQVYGLGLDVNSLHVASGFGGGLGVQSTCGGICGAVMAIGVISTSGTQHQTPGLKEKIADLLTQFAEQEGSLDCRDLRTKYFEQRKCAPLLAKIAEVLDDYYKQVQTEKA